MRQGVPVEPRPALAAIRERCAAQVGALPQGVRRLHDADRYPVTYSEGLVSLQQRIRVEVEATELAAASACIET